MLSELTVVTVMHDDNGSDIDNGAEDDARIPQEAVCQQWKDGNSDDLER
jgi:hypothetical protein